MISRHLAAHLRAHHRPADGNGGHHPRPYRPCRSLRRRHGPDAPSRHADATSSTPRATLARTTSSPFSASRLPFLGPALVGGMIFCALLSIDDFVRTFFLGGYQATLPMLIFAKVQGGMSPEINAMATRRPRRHRRRRPLCRAPDAQLEEPADGTDRPLRERHEVFTAGISRRGSTSTSRSSPASS